MHSISELESTSSGELESEAKLLASHYQIKFKQSFLVILSVTDKPDKGT